MSFSTRPILCFRLMLLVLLSSWLLLAQTGCHRYHISDPQGPPQPKMKKAKASATNAEQSADGSSQSTAQAENAPPQHNSYDKQGLLKKKKYERRRLKRKVGQYRFLGIIF
ncbi:hypothetical protein MUN82_18530 [Hymenobacter aerilatus]|uniref:Uncharacterized protein n=1 Tax=Hymenobacter aerilatus TaxID=2932251 RepID=A0A8T9SW42_9BACT|nr:hypothetical protein [Hymenobacter aerilatus]UOR04923.1 hypothetical protein MUN82_18530 [Hymenobacter aerilatus]